MKKITFLSLLLISVFFMNAQEISVNPETTPGANSGNDAVNNLLSVMLTQSIDPFTVDAGGVSCWDSGDGSFSANSYMRVYNLVDFGVDADFTIESVEYGQGSASEGKVLALRIYTADTDDLSTAALTFVAEVLHTATSADDLSLVSVPLSTTVPAGSTVVFEVFASDSAGLPDATYFPGLNAGGENDDSYLMSADCSIDVPTTTTEVGFADNQYVMNVIGDETLGLGDNLSELVSIYPNPVQNRLNVEMPSNIDLLSSTLYDLLGRDTGVRLVNGTMNTSGLARGVYILNVDTNAGTITQKIIKQ